MPIAQSVAEPARGSIGVCGYGSEVPNRPVPISETYASGPFVSIRAGGPFNGVVTITEVADGNGRVLVEAAWTRENKPQSASRIVVGEDPARTLAQQWADQLATGTEPPPD